MSQFVMPSLGADMESAVLMEWHVKEGDHVEKGQVIAEVETNKGVIEIEVFEDGIVEKILVQEETECAVGTPLAIIRTENDTMTDTTHTQFSEPQDEIPQPALSTDAHTVVETPSARVKASPAARRKAKELGIELSTLAAAAVKKFIWLK